MSNRQTFQDSPDVIGNLTANSTLNLPSVLASPNGQFCLTLQDDANLVLFNATGSVLFSSETTLSAASSLHLRWDGNLMLRASTGSVIWQTRKWNSSAMPYALVLGNDGSLQVTGKNGYVLWSRAEGGYIVRLQFESRNIWKAC